MIVLSYYVKSRRNKKKTDMLHPIQTSICSKVTIRHILLAFLVLSILVSVNLLSSTSRLSVIVDVSMKMKADAMDAVRTLINFNTAETINGSFSVKTFNTKSEMDNDMKMWRSQRATTTTNNSITQAVNIRLQQHTLRISTHLEYGANNITVTDATISRNNTKERSNYVNIERNMTKINESTWKNGCDNCFKHEFNYVIENEIVCEIKSPDQKIDVLVLILTIHKNTQARNALRTTWLTYSKNNTANMRYAFLLGKTNNLHLDNIVLAESKQFNDIIKEDFIDSYMNLTYKTIMGFKWAATKCAHAHYVMKTDDDMFVNMPNLIKLVQEHGKSLQTAIGGSCSQSAKPIRNKNSKWYASYSSYPSSTYPGFCSGTGYITSMNVAKNIFEISSSVPFFHLEDVYVAICAKKLRYKLIRYNGFNTGKPRFDPCIYKGQTLVTAHQLPPLLLKLIWQKKCSVRTLRVPGIRTGNKTRS